MAKIKTLTSMNRQGVAIPTNSEIDVPEAEAVALCRNSLAAPIGWELDPIEDVAGDEPDEGSLTDGEAAATGKKKTKAKA